MKTIESLTQSVILDLLPDDELQARLILAQFSANVILSQDASIEEFIALVRQNYDLYVLDEERSHK